MSNESAQCIKNGRFGRYNWLLLCGLVPSLFATHALAQTEVRVLGGFSNQLQNTQVEKPFFEQLGAALGGDYNIQFNTLDGLGLQGFDGLRQLQTGIFQIMAFAPGYVAGDEPFFSGIDQPGLTPNIADARKGADAFRDAFDARLQEKFNGKVLAIWPYPAQTIFCKPEVSGIEDLRGKKVRVFNPSLAAVVENFGGTPITLSFPEVYEGLQRGIADCAVTSALSANENKWFEVTEYLYPISLSWALQTHVANLDFWNSLSEEDQEAFLQQFSELEDQMWTVAEEATQDGVNCNVGSDPCVYGVKANMKLAEVTEADQELLSDAAVSVVLPLYAESCTRTYPECVDVWNETFGKAIGVQISQ